MKGKAIKTDSSLLILQHPQESDHELGTARLTHETLENSRLKVGLSWPNLERAWGEKTDRENWLVLYLGSIKLPHVAAVREPKLQFISKKNAPLKSEENVKRVKFYQAEKSKGIIVLDGTWSQAKTIWWRNAWLTKIARAVVLIPGKSLYGNLRKEPRRESISTIEAVAYTLQILERDTAAAEQLIESFKELLAKYRRSSL